MSVSLFVFWPIKIALIAAFVYHFGWDENFQPVATTIKSAAPFTGALEPKKVIKEFEIIAAGQVQGVESLYLAPDGRTIYAADQKCRALKIVDGKVVQSFDFIKNKQCVDCCSPLGIRHWRDSKYVIVDGVLGVLVLDYQTEQIDHILPATTIISRWGHMFADDFDFIDADTILFSDLDGQCVWSHIYECLYGLVESSRLIQFNLKTRETKVLLEKELTLNGVQRHADNQSVLITQSAISRIIRYYYAGPKKGKVEVFADELPGLPDNIRASKKGNTYWVTFFQSRPPGSRTLMQSLAPYPAIRKALFAVSSLTSPKLFALLGTVGTSNSNVFLELDGNGNVINSIHDLEGKFGFTTQVTDGGTHLYLSSIATTNIAKVKKP